MPAMHLVSTVLPAPLSPHRAVTCLGGMSRSTWYSAWTGPKCLSSPRILSNGSPAALAWATAAVISIALSPLTKENAAASCGGVQEIGYEMPAAEQTAAVTFWHSAPLSTKLSLITVSFMLALLTQIGTNRTAGCWVLPATGDGGAVVPLTRPVGGVWPARRTVASATAACASR